MEVIDISHLAPGTQATLYFDLLGFGDRAASAVLDNVILLADGQVPPIAADDSASTDAHTPVTIAVLDNDRDPDSELAAETLSAIAPVLKCECKPSFVQAFRSGTQLAKLI